MDSDPAQDMTNVSDRRLDDKCLFEMVSVPSFADDTAQETIVCIRAVEAQVRGNAKC